jgi:uncharacterized membrane protein
MQYIINILLIVVVIYFLIQRTRKRLKKTLNYNSYLNDKRNSLGTKKFRELLEKDAAQIESSQRIRKKKGLKEDPLLTATLAKITEERSKLG